MVPLARVLESETYSSCALTLGFGFADVDEGRGIKNLVSETCFGWGVVASGLALDLLPFTLVGVL